MDSCCRIEMLGPLRIIQPQRIVTRFGTQKAGALLAFLALRAGRAVPREELIDLFWGDMDLSAGRDNLSTTLSALRRMLEPPGIPRGGVLAADRAEVAISQAAVTTDVSQLERLIGQARKSEDPRNAAKLWEQAVGLFRGGFLEGCYLDWAVREGERLQSLHLTALEVWTHALENSGEIGDAIQAARRWADTDPYSEEAQNTLIRLSIRGGHPDAARDAYRKLERMLQDEYGTSPAPAIRALAEGLVSRSACIQTPIPPTVTQIIPAHPPQTAVTDGEIGPAALPAAFSRFFGREAELALLGRMIVFLKGRSNHAEEQTRLVTLTGPGGTGKTRLALELARQGVAKDGFWAGFIPLADIATAEMVLPHIAQILRLPTVPGTGPLDSIAAFFAALERNSKRPAMLVLDNLEQIAGCDAVVGALMERIPTLTCLCTSRRRLGLRGERVIPVLPLAVPDHDDALWGPGPTTGSPVTPADLLVYPSVCLYVDRAQAVRPDFQITPGNADAIAGLCRALEGSPLALELAASWVRALPPRAMHERLARDLDGDAGPPEARYGDLPPRHRSLWAALDWSFRLLTPAQQRLFARLSAFRGGWTLEICEAVCDEPNTLALLADLEEASLIQSAENGDGTVRWSMPGTVRRHAGVRLRARQDDAAVTLARHLDVYLGLAERTETGGHAQKLRLDTLESEHDNLRAALGYADDGPEALEKRLRLAAALLPFWRARGYLKEGQQRTDTLLALPDTTRRSRARAAALNSAGVLAMLQSEYAAAETRHVEAQTIAQEHGDAALSADAALGLGNVRFFSQDYVEARRFFEESLTLRPTGDNQGLAASWHSLGSVALREERYADAARCYERALCLRREMGDVLGTAASVGGLGQVALARQDYEAAAALIREALRLFAEAGQQWTTALCLENLSLIAAAWGQDARASRLLGASMALRERFHFRVPPAEQSGYEERLTELRDRLGHSEFATAWDAGHSLTWEDAVTEGQQP